MRVGLYFYRDGVMAWNQPNKHIREKRQTAFFTRRTVAFLIFSTVLIFGLVCIFLTSSPNEDKISTQKSSTKVVKKNTTTKKRSLEETEQPQNPRTQVKTVRKGFAIHVDENGIRRYANGVRVYDEKTPMSKPSTPFGDKPVFKNKALNELASFINLQPGATLFGTRRYDQNYLRTLKKGLEEEIEIFDEDDEVTRQTKLEMKEIQKEFKQMSDAEILAMVKDTYSELQRLARYRDQIKGMVKEASQNSENFTEQDYHDLIAAANEMLKKEGIAPIRDTVLVRKNIKLNSLKKRNQ